MDQENTLLHALALKFLLPSISQPTKHHWGHPGAFSELDLHQLPWAKGVSWRAASPGWDTWEQGGFSTPRSQGSEGVSPWANFPAWCEAQSPTLSPFPAALAEHWRGHRLWVTA